MAQDNQTVMDAAAALFARAQSGSASPAEVDAWLDADDAHAAAYARVEAAWERAERLKAWPQPAAAPAFQPTRRMAAGLAVGLLGAGAAGSWFLTRRPVEMTARGERRTVNLPDGSRVELNTDSRIAVAYSDSRRDIVLTRGEALFDVAKDPSRPFVVQAGEAQVRAVGTAFNIRLRDKVVELTVTEGVVTVDERAASAAPPRRVSEGKGAMIATGAVAEVDLDPEVLRRRLLWRDGVVEFEGDTLEQAAAEFNRYNDRKLVIADPQVASIRVGGRFGTHEVDRFLGALQAGFPVRAVPGDGQTTYLVQAS
jgi:transmembrane sensor